MSTQTINPTPAQLAAFSKGTASDYDPQSWLDRNKMNALIAGNANWSDNASARAVGPSGALAGKATAPSAAASTAAGWDDSLPAAPLDTSYALPAAPELAASPTGFGESPVPDNPEFGNPNQMTTEGAMALATAKARQSIQGQTPPESGNPPSPISGGAVPRPLEPIAGEEPGLETPDATSAPRTIADVTRSPEYKALDKRIADATQRFDTSNAAARLADPMSDSPFRGLSGAHWATKGDRSSAMAEIRDARAKMDQLVAGVSPTPQTTPESDGLASAGEGILGYQRGVQERTQALRPVANPAKRNFWGVQENQPTPQTSPESSGNSWTNTPAPTPTPAPKQMAAPTPKPAAAPNTAKAYQPATKPALATAATAKAASNNPLLTGWQDAIMQKQAMSSPADTESLERAFMDQAYAELRSRCKMLLRDPHRIGFEIVYKNDDATRMVGLFGFRSGRQLFFVPAFFLNAMIKGLDLLYRSQTRSFVPNTEEWVAYLMEQAQQTTGSPVSRNESRRHSSMNINMDMLAAPPYANSGSRKYASEQWLLDESPQWNHDDMADMFKAAQEKMDFTGGLLREFLSEVGPEAVAKVASWVNESDAFAEAIVSCVPDSDWMLDLPSQKKASSPTPRVWLHTTPIAGKTRAEHWLKHAFDIIDEREEDALSPVYENVPQSISEVDGTGMWKLLMADGSHEDAVIGYEYEGSFGRSEDSSAGYPAVGGYPRRPNPLRVIVMVGNHHTTTCGDSLFGEFVDRLGDCKHLKDKPESGKAYRAVNVETGVMSPEFFVKDTTAKDGITTCRIEQYSRPSLLVVNPEFSGCFFETGDLGSCVKFLPVAFEKKETYGEEKVTYKSYVPYGNDQSLSQWILGNSPAKKASVEYQAALDTFRVRYDGSEVGRLRKQAAAVNLVSGLGIHADTAFGLIEEAEKSGKSDFFVWAGKKAFMQLSRDPFENFQTQQDPNFGTPLEYPQMQTAMQDWAGTTPEPHRIGDAWDPTLGSNHKNDGVSEDDLLRRSPDEISQLAMRGQMPRVFEHGVIGELVHTFDANILVSRYIPKIEEGVDHTGRLLFLLYWKPGDFEFSYGVDDMRQMENTVLSNFKSQGQMLLDLKKKSGSGLPNTGATSLA